MRICSDQPCIVLLTEKDVWIRVNGKEPISLKANHMALLNCENNIIDVSSLNNTLVAHISHDIIKDYLRFLNKDLSQIPVWQRSATPILTLPCLTPDVFRVAAQHSMMPAETESEKERTRALLFTVLSRFLDSKKFLSLMMYMLPEYHVVLCVRQEYFDGPELDRLILDAWSNVLGFASPGEAKQYQKQITRDVVLDSRSPDCENILKELIWAFSDFARDRRGVCDPEARCLAGNPGYPGSAGPF
ncbi:hypothetical protein LUA72_13460 [Escherichia coli]|uniref:hypothetical protein n=1 Tax=Escherichia coli TaxID=562 RepID=UPI001E463851|nr:hypothetical protein [Escherichia coli]MCD8577606.1 hypothetical protein [Escherichia coli]MCD8582503.1 hypothetical protein [Escherichia coli]MCD8586988.1 hypothetical protein [Escherichia coli]MCD8589269.1 hypothetical protein [Escherichia coli]MCD8597441.1 hypothetical protein [Escherichia coli]